MKLIVNHVAKQATRKRIEQLQEKGWYFAEGRYKTGGRFCQGSGLNADLGWGEHKDGITRYYNGALVHEEKTA